MPACLLCLAALALASSPLAAQYTTDPLGPQPELTASDIPAAIELLEAARDHPGNPNVLLDVHTKYRLNAMRGMYITGRVMMGIGIIISGSTLEETVAQLGKSQMPSPAEFEIIKENQAALIAAMGIQPL
jgi:hypothetical protein